MFRLLLLATFLSFSGCALFAAKIKIELPARPDYEQCPVKPDVQGKIASNAVVIEMADAKRLRDWIAAYQTCMESNQARADGHIEKLENRLKAVGK